MKIAIIGYGKMGRVVEQIAIERGHEIVLKIGRDTKQYDINVADIAIDFSIPSAAYTNISNCILNNTPIVSGTTGWLERKEEIESLCSQKKGAFIYASNFSLGVNLFFELNQKLAKTMAKFSSYDVSMEEIHHTQKLDAPSGTAISLAEAILEESTKTSWTLENRNENNQLFIDAKRIPEVPGTHSIKYQSLEDSIEIKHTAHNRNGFALGAIIAAEWLLDKEGIYTMKDVLDL